MPKPKTQKRKEAQERLAASVKQFCGHFHIPSNERACPEWNIQMRAEHAAAMSSAEAARFDEFDESEYMPNSFYTQSPLH